MNFYKLFTNEQSSANFCRKLLVIFKHRNVSKLQGISSWYVIWPHNNLNIISRKSKSYLIVWYQSKIISDFLKLYIDILFPTFILLFTTWTSTFLLRLIAFTIIIIQISRYEVHPYRMFISMMSISDSFIFCPMFPHSLRDGFGNILVYFFDRRYGLKCVIDKQSYGVPVLGYDDWIL